MAIIYVDNILGDDTNTGLTSSSPLKSINQGLQISSNNDEIRVAGGSFSLLPGFITNRTRNTTILTTDDYSALGLTAGDILAFDTNHLDNWPLEYSTWTVKSVSTASVVFHQKLPFGEGTFSVYRFQSSATQSFHYQSTLTSGSYETISAFTASVLSVSGGWNSTFDTQWGWTGVKSGVPTSYSGRNLFGSSVNISKPGVVFDKFLMANCRFNNAFSAGVFGIDEINFTFVDANWFVTSNGGLVGPSASNNSIRIKIAQNQCQALSQSTNSSGGITNRFVTGIDYWVSSQGSGTNQIMKGGFGGYFGKVYFRTQNDNQNTSSGSLTMGWQTPGPCEELNIYMYSTASLTIPSQWTTVLDFNLYSGDGTKIGLQFTDGTSNVIPMIKYNGIFDDFDIRYPAGFTDNIYPYITKPSANILDNEGHKVAHLLGLYFADSSTYSVLPNGSTSSGSMRSKIIRNDPNQSTRSLTNYIGAVTKPLSTFTFSCSLKSNVPALTASSLSYNWCKASSDAIVNLSGFTITDEWQRFTYSIDPSTLKLNRTNVPTGEVITAFDYFQTPIDLIQFYLVFPSSTSNAYGYTQSIYVYVGDITIQ